MSSDRLKGARSPNPNPNPNNNDRDLSAANTITTSNNNVNNSISKDDAADSPPFPYLSMAALCLGMLAHSCVFTSPLPYVAFMVVDFALTADLDSAGYFAGYITGKIYMIYMIYRHASPNYFRYRL